MHKPGGLWEPSSVVEQRADNAKVDGSNPSVPIAFGQIGKLAEWFKAQHWKCCVAATSPRVQISHFPPLEIRVDGPQSVLKTDPGESLIVRLYVSPPGELAQR